MTLTQENNTFILASQLLTNWITSHVNATYTLKIAVQFNCEDFKEFTLVDGMSIIDGMNNQVIITPEDLGYTETFTDGIYNFSFVKEENDESSIVTEQKCDAVLDILRCNLVMFLLSNLESNIDIYYDALLNSLACGECGCKDACTFYDILLKELEKEPLNDCGCNS